MDDEIQTARDLFRHVSTDKAQFYRVIMEAFAAAKRQFRLHLRPDEVQIEAQWPSAPPTLEEKELVRDALTRLAMLRLIARRDAVVMPLPALKQKMAIVESKK